MYNSKIKLLYKFLKINNFNHEAGILKRSSEKYKSFKHYFDKANEKMDEEEKIEKEKALDKDEKEKLRREMLKALMEELRK